MGDREVSFSIKVKDAATAALKDVEKAAEKVSEKLIGLKEVLGAMTGALAAFSLVEVVKDMVDLGVAADATFRQIAANLPTFTQGLGDLKEGIEAIANASGRGLEAMEQSAAGIAKLGVSSAEELQQVLSAATMLADATGTTVDESAQLLIQLRREFHLTGDEALGMAAKLASVTQGKIGITELQTAFLASAPTFIKLGIDADTATRALGTLVAAGFTTSRAIRGEIGKFDAEGIHELAAQTTIASDALDQLHKRSDEVRGSTERLHTALKNQLTGVLEELGTTALPTVNKYLTGMVGLLEAIKGGNYGQVFAGWASTLASLVPGLEVVSKYIDSRTNGDDAKSGPRPKVIWHNAASLESQGLGPPKKILPEEAAEKKAAEEASIAQAKLALKLGETALAEDQARQKAEDLARAQGETLSHAIEQSLGALTGNLAQAAGEAIDDRAKKLQLEIDLNTSLDDKTKLRLMHEVEQTRELQQAWVRANADLEKGRDILSGIGTAGHTPLQDGNSLMAQQQQLLSDQKAVVALGGDDAKIKAQLLEIDRKRADILKGMAAVSRDVADSAKVQMQNTVEHARALQGAVDGALQLAGAFKLVDQHSLSLLRNIAQVATQIPVLVSQMQNLGKSDAAGNPLATGASVVGAALPVVGALAAIGVSLLDQGATNLAAWRQFEDARVKWADSLEKLVTSLTGTDWQKATAGLAGQFSALIQQALTDTQSAIAGSPAARFGASGVGLFGKTTVDLPGGLSTDPAHLAETIAAIQALQGKGKNLAQNVEIDNLLAQLKALDAEYKTQAADLAVQQALIQKQAQEDYRVRELAAEGHTAEADALALAEKQEREYAAAVKSTSDQTTLAALKAAQAAEAQAALAAATQKAAEAAVAAATTQAAQDAQIGHVTDPTQLFSGKAKAYAGAGGALGALLGGFDLDHLNPDSIGKLDAGFQDLFKQLEDSPGTVDLAGLSIDDLKKALLDLDQSAQSVAASVVSAAQKMAAAESSLSTDYSIYGTSAADQAVGYAGGFGLDLSGFDLSSQAGVDGARQAIRDFYTAHKTDIPGIGQFAQSALGALGNIQLTGPASALGIPAIGGPSVTAGATSAVASGFQSLTTIQGDRMADILLRSLNVQMDTRDLIGGRAPVNLAGAAKAIFGGPSGSGAPGSIGPIIIQVTTDKENAADVGSQIADAFVRELDVKLGRKSSVQALYNGDITVRPA